MPPRPSRREFGLLLGSLLTPLAGCSGIPGIGGSASDPNCEEGTVSIRAERREPGTNTADQIDPIAVSELPEQEQELVTEAVRTGEYLDCFPGPAAFESFRDRAIEHVTDQHQQGGPDDIFVIREKTHYEITIRSLDQVAP